MRADAADIGRSAVADVPFAVIGVPFRRGFANRGRIIGPIGFILLYSYKSYAGFRGFFRAIALTLRRIMRYDPLKRSRDAVNHDRQVVSCELR